MGSNLSLAEIRKIAKHVIDEYRKYASNPEEGLPEYPEDEFDHALANVLNEIHLTTLAKEIKKETKIVRGD